MKIKPYLRILPLSLVALIAGCSYGGTAVIAHADFVSFYQDEKLNLQNSKTFAVGDIISLNSSLIDGDENHVTESFNLSTGSYSRWASEHKGSPLSFAYVKDVKDASKVQIESKKYSSILSFNSTKIADDESEGKNVTTADINTFVYKIDDIHGTEENFDKRNFVDRTDSYEVSYYSEDYGKTVKTTTKTWSSIVNTLSLNYTYNESTDITKTDKVEQNYSFTYVEIIDGLDVETSLTYSFSSVTSTREEVLDDLGHVISGDKTIITTSEATTMTDNGSNGDKQYKESVFHWNGAEYFKDSENSTSDTSFRFDLQQSYLDSFMAGEMFEVWSTLAELTAFLADLTIFYDNLFFDFETYLNGAIENEEIVKEGLTYQYRSLLSSDANSYEIMQYTFVKPTDESKNAYLSDVSYLLFDSASDSSVLLARVSIVY